MEWAHGALSYSVLSCACADDGVAQISALALASEVLPGEEGVEALRMAENAARFIKEKMWDPESGELCRSWREGKGPRGVGEDYAFLIQGTSHPHSPPSVAHARASQACSTSTKRAGRKSTPSGPSNSNPHKTRSSSTPRAAAGTSPPRQTRTSCSG